MLNKNIKKVLGYLLLALIALPFVFYYLVLWGTWGNIPDEETISRVHNIEGSLVFAEDGEVLGRFYIQDRTPVALTDISPDVIHALVATEDERFYKHHGTDYRSLVRVLFKSLMLQDRSSGGGSTITQQLAKNLYPRISTGFLFYPVNKTREVIIAGRMEEVYSKEQILELYLNTVSFGEDVYGIESASIRFFGKKAIDLNLEEAATLVGMLKATTSYNPDRHPEAAKERRNIVLGQLSKAGYIAEDSLDYWRNTAVVTHYTKPNKETAAYFIAQVKNQARKLVEVYNQQFDTTYSLEQSGLKIYTTLNINMQKEAEKAMHDHMQELQALFDKHWENGRLWKEQTDLLNQEINKVRNGRSDVALAQKRSMVIFDYDGETEKKFSALDSLQYYLQQLQAGFVSLDPQSGAIKTWVGGTDYRYFPYDHVSYSAKRQVGSVFKPVVYAAALEHGISPCSYYKAEQVAYEVEEGEWSPGNSGNEYEGKYSMEGALEGSINTISVKILQDVGIDSTIAMAKNLGIRTDLPEVPSIALGTASISLLEMVTAYSVLSNGGFEVNPYQIERIEDASGEVLYQHEQQERARVIDEETSQIMVYLLQNVVNDGTGRSLRTRYNLPNDIGGKTGTTQGNADGWFIGVSPRLVSGAWVGGIYPAISFRETSLGQGARVALPIFAGFYQGLNSDNTFRQYTSAKYPTLSSGLANKLDCDPFKEQFELFQWLFGKKKDQEIRAEVDGELKEDKKENGFFKKVGSIFKKKKKN